MSRLICGDEDACCPMMQNDSDMWEKQYYALREQRIFFIDYEIEEDYSLMELAKAIVEINAKEKNIPSEELKPIQIWIMCYGGDVHQARFFCDLLETSRVPVVTVATGAVMSAGLLILLSGKRRYAFKQSEVMIHQGSAVFAGSAQEVEMAQDSYKKQLKAMKDYILSHTKISESMFKRQEKKDWYIMGEQLVELGIVNSIVTDFSDIK